MTRREVIAAVFATLLSSLVLHGAVPGPKAGFRFFKWGDPPAPEMKSMGLKKGGMDAYFISDDDMQIAGRKATLLTYYFFRKRLCRVEATFSLDPPQFTTQTGSMLEFARMGAMLEREWGAPDEVDNNDAHIWLSSDGKTEAVLLTITLTIHVPFDGFLIGLDIEERECARLARSGAGV